MLRPVYYWDGKILDGRKLASIASTLGRPLLLEVELESEAEAMHFLALHHPERALARWPCKSAREASEKFGIPIRKVAKFFQPAEKTPRVYARRRVTGARTRGRAGGPRSIHLNLRSDLLSRLELDAQSIGVSKSDYMRAALQCVTPAEVRTKLITMSLARQPQGS